VRLALAGRAEQADVAIGQDGLKTVPVVVPVRDDDLPVPAGDQGRVGHDVQQYLPLVGLGAGQRGAHRQAVQVRSRCRRSPQK